MILKTSSNIWQQYVRTSVFYLVPAIPIGSWIVQYHNTDALRSKSRSFVDGRKESWLDLTYLHRTSGVFQQLLDPVSMTPRSAFRAECCSSCQYGSRMCEAANFVVSLPRLGKLIGALFKRAKASQVWPSQSQLSNKKNLWRNWTVHISSGFLKQAHNRHATLKILKSRYSWLNPRLQEKKQFLVTKYDSVPRTLEKNRSEKPKKKALRQLPSSQIFDPCRVNLLQCLRTTEAATNFFSKKKIIFFLCTFQTVQEWILNVI